MLENRVNVPLESYVDGVTAREDLENIKALVMFGDAYCSNSIRAVLGLPEDRENNNAGTE